MDWIRGILVAILLAGLAVPAAVKADTVLMKNGEIIEGTIIEKIPDQFLRITVANGYARILSFRDIDRVTAAGGAVAWQNPNQEVKRAPSATLGKMPSEVRVSAGLLIGPNYMYRHGESHGRGVFSGSTLGAAGGGVLDCTLKDFIAFRSGAIFCRRSDYNYLTVPGDIIVKSYVGPETFIYVLMGGSFSFLMQSSQGINNLDAGIDAGVGLDLPAAISKARPFLEGIYYWGFSNVQNGATNTTTNRGLEVRGGLRILL